MNLPFRYPCHLSVSAQLAYLRTSSATEFLSGSSVPHFEYFFLRIVYLNCVCAEGESAIFGGVPRDAQRTISSPLECKCSSSWIILLFNALIFPIVNWTIPMVPTQIKNQHPISIKNESTGCSPIITCLSNQEIWMIP